MRRILLMAFVLMCAGQLLAQKSYLFVWAGDDAKKAEDFMAVLDADPASPKYGQAVASVAVPGPSGTPHHTEMEMPAGGFLLANAFESGRTMLFDLREPRAPKLVTSFGEIDGYGHPHTFIRLPNGHVLGAFQYRGGGHGPKAEGGGLVEMDDHGKLFKSGSAVVPMGPGEVIRPYSLVAVPGADRVVSTNTSMHRDGDSTSIQIWRLSDLKLLKTISLPKGPKGEEHMYPGEPLLAADGKTVLIHTFNCGLYRLDGVGADKPQVRHLHTFEGKVCAVPVRIGSYWVQTEFSERRLVTLDLSDMEHPREVSRLDFDERQKPHWLAADATGDRLVMNSGEYGEHRLYMVNFDKKTGALKLDEKFRDAGSERPGVSMDGKKWPHGFQGDGYPHGTVFSVGR